MASANIVTIDQGTLKVSGTLNFKTVVPLRRQGDTLIRDAKQSVEVDFSEVQASGSAAVSLMMCWLRAASSQQKEIHFFGLPPLLEQIISVSGLAGHPAFRSQGHTTPADS